MQVNTDDVITVLLISRNEQGIRLLYRHYADTMYGIILRIVPGEEEAKEVLNDVFLKVYDNFVFGVALGLQEAEALYAPHAKLITNPDELPETLQTFIEETVRR